MKKEYMLITKTGVHYKLTEDQELKLRNRAWSESFKIEDCLEKVSNIAEILTVTKYYERFPDKRPVVYYEPIEDPKSKKSGMENLYNSEKNLKRALKQWKAMVKAKKKNKESTLGLEKLIEFVENKLEIIKNPKEKILNWEEKKMLELNKLILK